MKIEYERLEAVAKAFADLCRKIVERFKESWSNLKRFATDLFGLLSKDSKDRVSKSYPATQFTKGKQLKNFMLSNKPRRLCARTNC